MLKDSSDTTHLKMLSGADTYGSGLTAEGDTGRLPWGPVSGILYAALLYGVAQIGVALVLMLVLRSLGWSSQRAEGWLTNDTFAQFLYIALAEAATIWGIVWFVRRKKVSLRTIGWNRFQLRYIAIALVGLMVYFVGYMIMAGFTSALIPSLNLSQHQDIGFQNASTSSDKLMTFVSLVVLPPLAEETVFRGFMYTGLRRRFPVVLSAIITSLLFAIPHLQFGDGAPLLWVAALDTFVLSLVLCYVRERTDSLWPGIFIHALKNGIAFAALFLIT